MKIEKRSKGVRVTLTKTEISALASLLEIIGHEKVRNPVYWLARRKEQQKLFNALCGLVRGGSYSRVYNAQDDAELSHEHEVAERSARGVL